MTSAAILCSWKHLAEAGEGDGNNVQASQLRQAGRLADLRPGAVCQYRLSLVVEVCVVVESSGSEPRRPSPEPHCSRFCSSLDTLLENAV